MIDNSKYCYNPEENERAFYLHHVSIHHDEQIGMHKQKTWELSYIIRGHGIRVIGGKVEPFKENEIILIPPGIPHQWSFENMGRKKIENITLTFHSETILNIKNTLPELNQNINAIMANENAISFGGKSLLQLQKLLLQMSKEHEVNQVISFIQILDTIANPEVTETVSSILIEDNNTQRLQKVYMYVMCNYHQSISLSEISDHLHMEKTAFCTFFKKNHGKTFIEFLLDYRINIVCEMLKNTDKNISDICVSSGFQDIPYFNRIFKRYKKISPSEYRKVSI